jgi:hypothetical protein
MNLREWDARELMLAPDMAEFSAAYFSKYGFGYTGIAPEGIVGAAGLVKVREGNWEAWAYTTDLFPKYGIQIHRLAKNIIKGFYDTPSVRRIQCTVDSKNRAAVRWALKLFRQVIRLEQYGPEGQDFFMFYTVKR